MTDTPQPRRRAPGAGRPRKAGKRYQVRLPDELAAYLRETGGGEIAAGIVRLYNDYNLLARVLPQVAAALPVGINKAREEK